MISIMFRGASDAATLAGGPATSNALVGSCSPASPEQVRGAAYDAVEKVLNGLFQPLSPQVLTTRWNEAADAMAKHLKTNYVGPQ